jgi:hypothetical protein
MTTSQSKNARAPGGSFEVAVGSPVGSPVGSTEGGSMVSDVTQVER